MQSPKLICVVGARPNFIKIAPILTALQKADDNIQCILVHTGQHYDNNLADIFFKNLNIKEPDYELHVGSGTGSWQTAQIMLRFEKVVEQENPTAVLVVGDVNSTLACALVASKLDIPVVHVEAGLRSFDKTMPEEINRLLTDQLSTILFTTEMSAKANLLQEGINPNHIHFVGNVMIDTLLKHQHLVPNHQEVLKNLIGKPLNQYAMLTLHRPSNVDNLEVFSRVFEALIELSQSIPVVFPAHPRTQKQLKHLKLSAKAFENIYILQPLDYLSMLSLVQHAGLVLTDSGGLQEETTALGVPCLTLRYNTERPVTLTHGTNQIVGTEVKVILQKARDILQGDLSSHAKPIPLWDGHAAERLVQILVPWLYQPDNHTKMAMHEVALCQE